MEDRKKRKMRKRQKGRMRKDRKPMKKLMNNTTAPKDTQEITEKGTAKKKTKQERRK